MTTGAQWRPVALAAVLFGVSGMAAWAVATWLMPARHEQVALSGAAASRLAPVAASAVQVATVQDQRLAARTHHAESRVTTAPPEAEVMEAAAHASGDKPGVEYVMREEEGTVRRIEVVPKAQRVQEPAALSPFTAPVRW